MPLKEEVVKNAVNQMSNPSYIPPVDWFDIGKAAFFWLIDFRPDWNKDAINGWMAASWKCYRDVAVEDVRAAMSFAESIG